MLYKSIIFFESQKIPLTEIVCLRIVTQKILHNSTSPLVDMYSLVPAYSKESAVRETYQWFYLAQ